MLSYKVFTQYLCTEVCICSLNDWFIYLSTLLVIFSAFYGFIEPSDIYFYSVAFYVISARDGSGRCPPPPSASPANRLPVTQFVTEPTRIAEQHTQMGRQQQSAGSHNVGAVLGDVVRREDRRRRAAGGGDSNERSPCAGEGQPLVRRQWAARRPRSAAINPGPAARRAKTSGERSGVGRSGGAVKREVRGAGRVAADREENKDIHRGESFRKEAKD